MIATLCLAKLRQSVKVGLQGGMPTPKGQSAVRIAMRTKLLSAAIILAFAAPAYAQMNIMAPNLKYTTQDEVDQAIKQEKDYKSTMQKLPDQKASNDPWGNVRSTGTAQTEHKTKKKKASTTQ